MKQAMNTTKRFPTLFIPHGGGPCFFMETQPRDLWDKLAAYLKGIAGSLGAKPQAVLLISGHWEEPVPTLNTAPNPPLLFDYYGFPEHTYKLMYPAPGLPVLANHVRELLAAAGIASGVDDKRGLDHGVFVPFKLVYPDADVPIVQLSLHHSLDASVHLQIGRALAPLRDAGVLIVGSGMSYHNLREMFQDGPRFNEPAEQFDAWLAEAVAEPDEAERERKLVAWQQAPGALRCHPHPEHLLPLMVAAGAAGGDVGWRAFNDRIRGKAISGFQFGR